MSKGVNVENYPGLDGESGGEIIRLMKRQALKFSTTFADDWVTSVDLSVRPFVINTNGSALTAPSGRLLARLGRPRRPWGGSRGALGAFWGRQNGTWTPLRASRN